MMNHAIADISGSTAALVALTGYLVVFFGLALLMCVILLVDAVMTRRRRRLAAVHAAEASAAAEGKAEPAAGSAGELKLYDTDPRTAAMIMAIVADNLGKPVNELRFKSIREVK